MTEQFDFVETKVLAFEDLYGGKLREMRFAAGGVPAPALLFVHEPPLSAYLLHLAHRVDERDAPLEPPRLDNPGDKGRVPAPAHRRGDGYGRLRGHPEFMRASETGR
ncbi:MAG: hypothetical protein OXU81_23990 [Gammaproteobacteria bacterium]|nr:hypothetical protein [Gammaproteobacteria bacterium]